ncbi:hypothetical protein KR009_005190 [Drosophila setifemur]|nr:hypothetical protein KR009_005190 [Drosophila setifemur]
MRSQSGLNAVAQLLLLLLLLATTSTAVEAELAAESAGVSTVTPESLHPRRVVKRAPTSSFIGMRGKKDEERDTEADADAEASEGNWLGAGNGPDPLDYADLDSYYSENGRRLKKAPLAFVGMRGKKFTPISARLAGVLHHMEEERLRENLLQDFFDRLSAGEGGAADMEKRAPTGFTGMRGKRPNQEDDGGDGEDATELMLKRAPVNSFVGMRGKKDVSHQHYKRAALSEFWHTFFKKAYDVRGKKQRFADFNKFVAVRGKKSGLEEDGADTGDWEGQQQYLVQPWLNVWGDKRAPNGFLGMRGKRPGEI